MADHFAEEGLGADGIIVDSSVQSGSAWICVDDNGDNMIIVMPGANGAMTVADLKPFEDMIKSSEYLLMQLEVPMEVVAYAADIAHAAGVKVILNPAPACPLEDTLLSKLYALTPNETECRLLCGDAATDDDVANAAVLYGKGVKNATPVFLPRESHGQRSLAGYSPWGCKKSDTTERLILLWD